jgi:hypothetical protein
MGAVGTVAVDQRRRGPGLGLAHRAEQQHVVAALHRAGQLAGEPSRRVGQPRQAMVVTPVDRREAID